MAKYLFISDNLLASKQASKQASNISIKEKEECERMGALVTMNPMHPCTVPALRWHCAGMHRIRVYTDGRSGCWSK